MTAVTNTEDSFELWDLRVDVVGEQQRMVCDHTVGDYFELSGENLRFPEGQAFSLYALGCHPATVTRETANDRWQRLDDNRR